MPCLLHVNVQLQEVTASPHGKDNERTFLQRHHILLWRRNIWLRKHCVWQDGGFKQGNWVFFLHQQPVSAPLDVEWRHAALQVRVRHISHDTEAMPLNRPVLNSGLLRGRVTRSVSQRVCVWLPPQTSSVATSHICVGRLYLMPQQSRRASVGWHMSDHALKIHIYTQLHLQKNTHTHTAWLRTVFPPVNKKTSALCRCVNKHIHCQCFWRRTYTAKYLTLRGGENNKLWMNSSYQPLAAPHHWGGTSRYHVPNYNQAHYLTQLPHCVA